MKVRKGEGCPAWARQDDTHKSRAFMQQVWY